MPELFWHCATCGDHEPALPEYAHGTCKPCVQSHCTNGTARVMTLQEGAAIEQAFALGKRPK